MTRKITQIELAKILEGITQKNTAPLSVTTITEPAQNSKNSGIKIWKFSKRQCFFANYENMVRNLEVREGQMPSFVAQPRKWGVSKSLALIEHKGTLYADLRELSSKSIYYVKRNGLMVQVKKSEIAHLLREHAKPNTQAHLEGTVKVINPKLENITRLAYNKKVYMLPRVTGTEKQR